MTDSTSPATKPAGITATARFGVVDMGSNAIRVMIAEVGGSDRDVRIIESHRAPVRLGRDVFLTGQIPEASIEATVEVLTRFRESCDRHGVASIEAIATSAMRDAQNRNEVLERIRAATDIDVRVISGTDEAYYLLSAVRQGIAIETGRSLLVDLGGGSVEIDLVQDGQVVSSDSYGLGALRVLRALESDGVEPRGGASFLALLDEYIGAVEGRMRDHFGEISVDRYVATGGNIETIADVLAGEGKVVREEGVEVCRLADLEDLTRRLAVRSYAERMRDFQLRPDRADTILPAAVVYYRIGRAARAETVLVPRVGMREGVLHELATRHDQAALAAEHRDTLLAACRALGRRYHYDAEHAEIVRRIASSLFDQTTKLHGFRERERTLLEAAALLHDIGVFVNNARHHKHSWYLIRASDIVGLSEPERELVALIARYHRRSHPKPEHFGWGGLTAEERELVSRLAAILRLADSFDRGHQRKIDDVCVEVSDKALIVRPIRRPGIDSDLMLEKLGVAEKGRLFQLVFGRKVRLDV